MGEGDPFDEQRPIPVSVADCVQHLFRHRRGLCVRGLAAKRVIWALQNLALLEEASGKGFAVQRNVMRRLGGRVSGMGVLTRRDLQAIMDDEEDC